MLSTPFSQAFTTIRWVPILAALASVFLTPLVNLPDHSLWFDITPKISIFCMMTGIACFVPIDSIRTRSRFLHLTFVLSVALVISSTLSAAFSISPALSIGGSNWRRIGVPTEIALALFAFIQVQLMRREPHYIIWCLRLGSAALFISSMSVVVEALPWEDFSGLGTSTETIRSGGLLGSGASYGCYAVCPVFLCAALWYLDRHPLWRILPLCSSIIGIVGIVLCGTRAAAIGLFVGMAVCTFVARRPAVRWLCGIFITIAVFIFVILSQIQSPVAKRFDQIQKDLWGGTRLYIWADSIDLLRDLPMFGYGQESFQRTYPKVQSRETARRWPDTMHESTHNYLLDMLLSKGIPGFCLALCFPVVALRAFANLPSDSKSIYAYCLGGHAACLTSCMFFTPQLPTLVYLYLPVSLLAASADNCSSWPRPVLDENESMRSGRRLNFLAIVMTGTFGISLITYSVCLLRWDTALHDVEVAFETGAVYEAVERFEEARDLAPWGATADGWFSRELSMRMSHSVDSQLNAVLYRSLSLSIQNEGEFGNSSVLLAAAMIRDGRLIEAKRVLLQTVRQFPAWPPPKEMLRALESR